MGRVVKAGETRALWNGARQYHSVAHGGAPPRRGQRAIKTWGGSGRPGSEALPAEYRDIGLQLGHDARASSDIAVRRNNASLAAASRKSRAMRSQSPCCDMVRGEITTSHPATPYDVAGGGRARRGAIAAGRGNKALPVRISTTNCVSGTRHNHLWTSRCSVAARGIATNNKTGGTRAKRDVARRAARSQPRARQHPAMLPATGKQDVGPRRTGGQRDVAGGESRPRFANWARGARLLGQRRSATVWAVSSQDSRTQRDARESRDAALRAATSQCRARRRQGTPLATV